MSIMSSHKLLCVVGIVALSIAFALPVFAQWDAGMEGYGQFRYMYSDSAEDSDFDARRVRVGWGGQVNEQGTTARVQFDIGDLLGNSDGEDVDLKDAWVMHPFTENWSTRLGFGSAEFGQDVPYSSSKRLPFERSMAARSFFPGERGLGALVTYAGPESSAVQLDLQVFDGMDEWHSINAFDDATSFLARLQYGFNDQGTIGASFMTSDIDVNFAQVAQGSGNSGADADVWGFHLLYDYANLGFRGEYFDGDWVDYKNSFNVYDADGWFAEVNYTPENSVVTPFYRYDEFGYSQNVAVAQKGGSAAEYVRHTVGVAYEPFANNRLTLQVEDIDAMGNEDTTVGVQWQVSYK